MAHTNADVIGVWQTSSTKAEIRTKLRNLLSPVLDSQITNSEIADYFEPSPYVGDEANQVNVRSSKAGYRDALGIEVMTMILLESVDLHASLTAICDGDCLANPSNKSVTGVHFGWPNKVIQEYWNQLVDTHKLSDRKETSSMGYDALDLNALCIAHAILCDDFAPEDINQVFTDLLGKEKADGIFAMAELSPNPEREDTAVTDTTFYKDCLDKLGAVEEQEEKPAATYTVPSDDGKKQLLDLALDQAGLPNITDLLGGYNSLTAQIEKLKSAPTISISASNSEASVSHSDDIPSGSVSVENAADVFEIKGKAKQTFPFDVPVWHWDSPHPHVPAVDPNYQFQPMALVRVLYAIITNNRCYLHGHTGTGKTTLVEQVAARMNYPFMRLNFDSEITRMDLIGRDVLTQEDGTTTSAFVEGILPQMMQGPYIGCFDEIDFVRPDVSYVMQRALEGNGLMLTEDGGRMIVPHKMFRMFATGNTVGQGDEFGMYQGARPQSLALLDRFTVWAHIEYMPKHQRKKLIKANAPRLNDDDLDKIDAYVAEHLSAFKEGKVLQPISPRGYIALGQAVMGFYSFFPKGDEAKAFQQAFETVILDRATVQDKVVLNGIAQRVFS